jgi:TonB family protein
MRSFIAVSILFAAAASAIAQRTAVIAPDEAAASVAFGEVLSQHIAEKQAVLDNSLVRSAYVASAPDTRFNMTRAESARVAAAIGADSMILVRAATLRRSASDRPAYYEASAFMYLVSGRTGRLVFWKHLRYDADTARKATGQLLSATGQLAGEIDLAWREAKRRELTEPARPPMEEPPAGPLAGFRNPIPYRRIKPAYTAEAAYYDIAATVEITVDLGADGTVLRTEIERWAGFGLDESVEKAVRTTNWRPAERNGKFVPMRFLLRYNFTDIE